jgi:hypothetical protein
MAFGWLAVVAAEADWLGVDETPGAGGPCTSAERGGSDDGVSEEGAGAGAGAREGVGCD